MSKLVYLVEISPVFEDDTKSYSRTKFYSDTVIKLALAYSTDTVSIVYPELIYHKDGLSNIIYDSDKIHSLDPFDKRYDNCQYLINSSNDHHLNIEFKTIRDFIDSNKDEYVVLFGILNGSVKYLTNLLSGEYLEMIKGCKFYHYLSSDGELTDHPYRKDFYSSFSEMYRSISDVYYQKLKSFIITEVDDLDIVDRHERKGIDRSKLKYLPMIIDVDRRLSYYASNNVGLGNKNGKIMMLRGINSWYDEYPEALSVIGSKLDVYESPLPALRKRYLPMVEKYNATYKTARQWSTDKIRGIIKEYSFYIGSSSFNHHRFTYKIIESTDSGTLCLMYPISLKPYEKLGVEYSESVLDKYRNIFVLDDLNKLSKMISSISDEEYVDQVRLQYNFISEFFGINSKNINYLVDKIVKGE